MAKRTSKKRKKQNNTPWYIFGAVVVVGLIAFGVLNNAPAADQAQTGAFPLEISVQEAYEHYQDGTLILDVRTQEEWDEFHAPNTTLIPLDQLGSRLSELPQDEPIVVVCRSGNRSQAGRDILLANGYEPATSMAGGLNAWREAGFPIE